MELDVLVHGADLSAVMIWHGLRLRGYRALLIHEAMRVSEGVVFLPFTSEWARYLGNMGVGGLSEERKVMLRAAGSFKGWFYPPASVCVGNVRKIAENLISRVDEGVELWCRGFRYKVCERGIEWAANLRMSGEVRGEAQLLVETGTLDRGLGLVLLETKLSSAEEPVLDLSTSPLSLMVPHEGIETWVRIGSEIEPKAALCRSKLTVSDRIDLGEMPVLHSGFRSGIARPPWLGDYLAASAQIGIHIAENWVNSGDINDNLASHIVEITTRSNLCLEILNRSMQGKLYEEEVSHILEGLKPPPSYRP
ncbi:MAG: hypothetical protein QXO86_01160 [Nitrososphaerota archaeon]